MDDQHGSPRLVPDAVARRDDLTHVAAAVLVDAGTAGERIDDHEHYGGL